MLLKSHQLQACNYQILEQKHTVKGNKKNAFTGIKKQNWGWQLLGMQGEKFIILCDFACLLSYQTDS